MPYKSKKKFQNKKSLKRKYNSKKRLIKRKVKSMKGGSRTVKQRMPITARKATGPAAGKGSHASQKKKNKVRSNTNNTNKKLMLRTNRTTYNFLKKNPVFNEMSIPNQLATIAEYRNIKESRLGIGFKAPKAQGTHYDTEMLESAGVQENSNSNNNREYDDSKDGLKALLENTVDQLKGLVNGFGDRDLHTNELTDYESLSKTLEYGKKVCGKHEKKIYYTPGDIIRGIITKTLPSTKSTSLNGKKSGVVKTLCNFWENQFEPNIPNEYVGMLNSALGNMSDGKRRMDLLYPYYNKDNDREVAPKLCYISMNTDTDHTSLEHMFPILTGLSYGVLISNELLDFFEKYARNNFNDPKLTDDEINKEKNNLLCLMAILHPTSSQEWNEHNKSDHDMFRFVLEDDKPQIALVKDWGKRKCGWEKGAPKDLSPLDDTQYRERQTIINAIMAVANRIISESEVIQYWIRNWSYFFLNEFMKYITIVHALEDIKLPIEDDEIRDFLGDDHHEPGAEVDMGDAEAGPAYPADSATAGPAYPADPATAGPGMEPA